MKSLDPIFSHRGQHLPRGTHLLWTLGLAALLPALNAQPSLPFSTDFEASQGYVLGPLNGQLGWVVPSGDVEVINTAAYSGTQSVVLNPSAPVPQLTEAIAAASGETIVYVDFYAEPSADPVVTNSTLIAAGSAEVGFLLGGSSATLQVFSGNGTGGGVWTYPAAPVNLPLGSGSNQTARWHRFTFREDFGAKTWDFYVDGQMVAYDLPFSDATVTALTSFAISGHTTYPTAFDDFFAGSANPLFANLSNDGISDAWKAMYGLGATANLRYSSPSGNGITLLQDYVTGANPLDFYNGRALALVSPTDASPVTYSYDASGRLSSVGFGSLSTQSFTPDGASNLNAVAMTAEPIVRWRLANGLPGDGSGTGADTASPAGDNLPNLAKYGLGLVPLIAASGSYPTIGLLQSGGSSFLTLSYPCPSPAPADLSYVVQVSPDNATWSNGIAATTTVSTTTVGGVTTTVVQDNTAISTPTYGRYIRLQIVRSLLQQ